MPRFLLALFCALPLLFGSCHHSTETPEPDGPLEGEWQVGLTDIVMYDAQDKVVATYPPNPDVVGYNQLIITTTELEYRRSTSTIRYAVPYTHTGDQLICQPPERSYTIRKLTAHQLDLYLRGEYLQVGANQFRTDFVVHLQR